MGEVNYYLNGKKFKDYSVFVSDSQGLLDELATKNPNSYDWAEYNGTAVDLSIKRYKSREFELSCFVKGDNWLEMYEKFTGLITKEFAKTGTQRLIVDAFGLKNLAYEVYKTDAISLKKRFNNGETFGVFTLKLIEPNPIKKIFVSDLDLINLSFKSESEFEIFWGDGTKSIVYGAVNEVKDYKYPSYNVLTYSLIQPSTVNSEYYQTVTNFSTTSNYKFSVDVSVDSEKNLFLYVIGRVNNSYECIAISPINSIPTSGNIKLLKELNLSEYGKFIFKVLDENGVEVPNLIMSNPQINKVELSGHWEDMTGKGKTIIIAGNVEEIRDLTTNAELLWDRL